MRLLILGASGGCGRWAARLAAADGHDVTAMVRPSTTYDAPAGVRVVRASAIDPNDIALASEAQDVVISCIGPQRTNPANPWAPLRPPANVAELTARALVAGLAASSVRRVVAISAAGVGDSFPHMNAIMRWLVRRSTVGTMYADLDAMEQVFGQSGLDWLAVRPVTLVNAAPSNRAHEVSRFRTTSTIGRADVAAWLLKVAIDPAPISGRTPMIGWR